LSIKLVTLNPVFDHPTNTLNKIMPIAFSYTYYPTHNSSGSKK